MGAHLHLIGPLSIDLSAQAVKRAGLDYWDSLRLSVYDTPEDFLAWLAHRQPWLVSKRGSLRYDRVPFQKHDVLIFGNEVTGLPEAWHQRWPNRVVSVPILGPIRSYNLANTAAIVMAQCCLTAGLYEDGANPT